MKTLAVNNPMKTLTLAIASVAAGLLVGMALLAPISAVAGGDDDGGPPNGVQVETLTFTLVDNNGVPAKFTLVNNGGHFVLTLVPAAVQPSSTENDLDDE